MEQGDLVIIRKLTEGEEAGKNILLICTTLNVNFFGVFLKNSVLPISLSGVSFLFVIRYFCHL
jgi:hypothetical protein